MIIIDKNLQNIVNSSTNIFAANGCHTKMPDDEHLNFRYIIFYLNIFGSYFILHLIPITTEHLKVVFGF